MKLSLLAIIALLFAALLFPAEAQTAAGAPVRNLEDLLRGMPIGPGLISAGKPNAPACIKATEELSKIAVGRPIELQFAYDPVMSEAGIARSHALKHRHRLDEILVRFQIPLDGADAELRKRMRNGFAVGVKGTIKKVEFGPEGRKVMLLVTLGDVKAP